MKFTIFQSSRQGSRPYNQDRLAYSYSKDALLLVVADGMGGHNHGEIASQLAVKILIESFQRLALPILANPAKFLIDHIQQIHDTIDQHTQTNNLPESPRTTIVAAIIQRDVLYCAHVGDSRLYHFQNNNVTFRTEDHSVVQSLFRRGVITKEDMLTHPYKHRIYNCLGGDLPPQIELSDKRDLKEGDVILLCTDGLWGGFKKDEHIAKFLKSNPVNDSLIQMLDTAEKLNGNDSDNLSAIILQWGDKPQIPASVSTVTMPIDVTTTMINPANQNTQNKEIPQLSEAEIEKTIAEIHFALARSKRQQQKM